MEKNVQKFSKAKNNFEFLPKYVSFLHKFETRQKPETRQSKTWTRLWKKTKTGPEPEPDCLNPSWSWTRLFETRYITDHRKSLIYLRILGLQFQTAAEGSFDVSTDEINFVLEKSPEEEMKKKYEKTKEMEIPDIIFKQDCLDILIRRIDRLSLQALNVSEVCSIHLCRYV